jgi:RHS repeat-associated protein
MLGFEFMRTRADMIVIRDIQQFRHFARIIRIEGAEVFNDAVNLLRGHDGIGSITSLTSSSGALANTYTYDSFGKLTASTGTITNPYRYTGREVDSETGLDYNRARYYDPQIGRFLSEDPLRFNGDSPNFYAYARNNPIRFMDPSGLKSGFEDLQFTRRSCAKQRCIDKFLRTYYGNFVADTLVPNFSLFNLDPYSQNFGKYFKTLGEAAFVKLPLVYGPRAPGAYLFNLGSGAAGNMSAGFYAGVAGGTLSALSLGAEYVLLVGGTAAGSFATTADAYAQFECRNVE